MQYTTDANLKIRQQTHAKYTIGQPLEPWLDAQLALETNAALLDVGTATGAFPIRLRQAGHLGRLVGIDLSSGMIELAKAQNTNVEFLVADAMALPFPDSSFDVVTARHMLYHVPDIQKALLEIRRVLKPNGWFFALTNADGYLADYWAVMLETLREMPEFEEFIADHLSPKFFHKDLEQHIKKVFGETKLHLKPQHLEFSDSAAPLAYWHSMRAGKDIEPAVWEFASQKLEAAFAAKTQTPWRIEKNLALLKTHNSSTKTH
jgi:ubiquinone/menaquinone biosynthesis C-methylase UbiE